MALWKDKKGRYVIRIYCDTGNGRMKRMEILGEIPYKKAKEIHDKRKVESYSKPDVGQDGTFTQAVNAYLLYHGNNIKEKTKSIIQVYHDKHWLPFFGNVPVGTITKAKIEEYRTFRLSQKAKNSKGTIKGSTINREIAFLKSIFARGLEHGIITKNPFHTFKIKSFKEDPKTEFFEREEWEQFIKGLETVNRGWMIPFFLTLHDTVSRLSEISGLRVWDIDFKRSLITITQFKTEKKKTVPMSPNLSTILQAQIMSLTKKDGWLFPDKEGERLTNPKVQYAFERALKASGIKKPLTVHSVRHTGASWLAIDGFSESQIMGVTGHTTTQHVHRYMHLAPSNLTKLIESLGTNQALPEPKETAK